MLAVKRGGGGNADLAGRQHRSKKGMSLTFGTWTARFGIEVLE